VTAGVQRADRVSAAGPHRLAAALAARLVRPIGHFPATVHPLPPLAEGVLRALAADPAFGPPIQRAAATSLTPPLSIDGALLGRFHASAAARLAALLVVEPESTVKEAACLLAGVILHRGILAAVLKADRDRLRAAFGPAAFDVATREAALLHASLADIVDAPAQGTCLAGADPEAVRAAATRLGLATLRRFTDTTEPVLGALLALRFPGGGGVPLGPEACDRIVRLMRRRMDAWSPIIA